MRGSIPGTSGTIDVAMHAIGIDIGGTSTKAGRVDETGQILEARQVPTPTQSPKALLDTLLSLVDSFNCREAPIGIGLGVPGLRSKETGVVEFSPNLPCLNGVSIEDTLSRRSGLPVVGANDAEMSAWGEFSIGAGVGSSEMACLTLGTGVGSGLILNGRPYAGHRGYAGELGHVTVDPAGPPCRCGNRGCLETVASASAIVTSARKRLDTDPTSTLHKLKAPLTAATIHEAALKGDRIARETLAGAGRYVGIACAALINILDLEVIVIGGGVAAAGEFLIEHVKSEVSARIYDQVPQSCRIVPATLGNNAGVIGAALRALEPAGKTQPR
jgi:glucokinase